MTDVGRVPGALPEWLAEVEPDGLTAPFWSAAREHRLVCQRCQECGTFRMPPAPLCHVCGSFAADFEDLSGSATVYSYTVVHHVGIPGLADSAPYVVAVVALDDAPGARLVTNVVGCSPADVTVGMAVRVVWDDVSDTATIPRFAPTG
jgi:uncharacterized OB-fold protein